MGKSTISTGPCSIAMLVYQRVTNINQRFLGLSEEKNREKASSDGAWPMAKQVLNSDGGCCEAGLLCCLEF